MEMLDSLMRMIIIKVIKKSYFSNEKGEPS